jgi:hypothetical protein
MLSWNMLDDPHLQSLQALVIKEALRMKGTVSTLILCLESGMWPVYYYAFKSMLKFVHSVQKSENPVMTHIWSLAIRGEKDLKSRCLQLLSRVMNNEVTEIISLSDALDGLRRNMQQQLNQKKQDPSDPATPERRIASYLTWVWDDKLHRRPYFYSLPLKDDIYYPALKLRCMLSGFQVHVRHAVQYADRHCKCCDMAVVGDYNHMFLECPHYEHLRNAYAAAMNFPDCVPELLKSRQVATWIYMTKVHRDVCGQKRNARR